MNKLTTHARVRVRERFGGFNRQEVKDIIKRIRGGRAKLIRRQSGTISVYDVEHNEQLLRVVYSSSSGNIITIYESGSLLLSNRWGLCC